MVSPAQHTQQSSRHILDLLPQLAEPCPASLPSCQHPVAVLVRHDLVHIAVLRFGFLIERPVQCHLFLLRQAQVIDRMKHLMISRALPAELRKLDKGRRTDGTLPAIDLDADARLDTMCRTCPASCRVTDFDRRGELHLHLCPIRHGKGKTVSIVPDIPCAGKCIPDLLLEIVKRPGLLLLLLLRKIPLRILKFSLD